MAVVWFRADLLNCACFSWVTAQVVGIAIGAAGARAQVDTRAVVPVNKVPCAAPCPCSTRRNAARNAPCRAAGRRAGSPCPVAVASVHGATGLWFKWPHTSVHGCVVRRRSQAAILDTGTNILLVPGSLLKPLQATMCADSSLAHCSDLWADKCLPLTPAQIAAYPPMALQLSNGVELHMTAADYLLTGSPLAGGDDNVCLGIKDGGSAGGGFIIGDTTMRNYYLVFDLAQKRIGWGPVNKDTCGSI